MFDIIAATAAARVLPCILVVPTLLQLNAEQAVLHSLYCCLSVSVQQPDLLVRGVCCCLQASQYNMPIYITETGIADRSDKNRATMIDKYMRAVSDSLSRGHTPSQAPRCCSAAAACLPA